MMALSVSHLACERQDEEQEIDIVNVYHDVRTLAQLDVCGRLGARDGRDESSKEDLDEDP